MHLKRTKQLHDDSLPADPLLATSDFVGVMLVSVIDGFASHTLVPSQLHHTISQYDLQSEMH